MPRIILASGSPRRQQLMRDAGFDFNSVVTSVDETPPSGMHWSKVPAALAQRKALAIDRKRGDIVVAADTIVVIDDTIIGKPLNEQDAKQMLRTLSGRTHHVMTGVCILQNEIAIMFTDTTVVTFKELTDADIDYYVNTFKPLDKAGAYAIQEWIGLIGVKRIEGDYFNVMGLPIGRVIQEMRGLTVT